MILQMHHTNTTLTKLFFNLHISLRPKYWSLKVSSTESRATSSGFTIFMQTSAYVRSWKAVAILCSTLIASGSQWNIVILISLLINWLHSKSSYISILFGTQISHEHNITNGGLAAKLVYNSPFRSQFSRFKTVLQLVCQQVSGVPHTHARIINSLFNLCYVLFSYTCNQTRQEFTWRCILTAMYSFVPIHKLIHHA